MNIVELLFLIVYIIFVALMWPAFAYWLIDTKKYGGGKFCAAVIGLTLAFVWPMSIIAVFFSEKQRSIQEEPDRNQEKTMV